jgi:hypothetical protein
MVTVTNPKRAMILKGQAMIAAGAKADDYLLDVNGSYCQIQNPGNGGQQRFPMASLWNTPWTGWHIRVLCRAGE